ncbi:MAG: hypothetical protein IH594_14525, partial [Bacteroidales bacterium]|nr:hypothetical protein [Bacteroidales bacterium]
SKEILDYKEETGKDALWTNSMFSGMPSYLIVTRMPNNILLKVHGLLTFQSGRPAIHIFLYMFGFYILLLLFGVNPWLGIVGGIAYGFSSYLFIILEPGHLTKAIALGYMPMVVGSVYYTFRKNFLTGAVLTAIFTGLQLIANHLQITYYTLLILLIFGIFELVEVIREKSYGQFARSIGVLILAVVIAVSVNIVNFWTVMEYSSYSLRGPSELSKNSEDRTSGLDKSYATGWSYGIGETLNLLIPNFKGGASNILLADSDSKTFDYLARNGGQQQAAQIINQNAFFFTQYWGAQPGTSGPVYIGAVLIFLFIFGMFFISGRIKWWLFSVVVFSILLSWGKNFMFLTELFLDHFPGYNKFRTVSMILVMAELAIPLLAILAVNKLVSGEFTRKEFFRAFRYSIYIAGGIALLYTLFPTISDLSSPKDEILKEQGARDLVNVILEDRADLLRKDAFRSLLFVLLGAGLVYAYYSKRLKEHALYALLGLLILVDLWPVNKRYLNDENFVPERTAQTPFQATPADLEILQDQELSFRVFDLTQGDPFASSRASWFHKSIGGYHGAKMRRYQEVYDHHIKESMDPEVLDMLNTKYLITRDPASGQTQAVRRNTNLGNAWFVAGIELVKNADEEIDKLGSLDPSALALVDTRFSDKLEGVGFGPDSTSTIRLVSYSPDRLEYEYATSSTQVAVFSEVYYPKGWNAYINGKENFHFRVNYVLRGMIIEPGEGSIVFEFKPDSYYKGSKIAFAGSVLLVLLIFGGIIY